MSGGELAIHCGRTADGHLDLLVMDRGKGFGESTTTAAGHGLGMEIIRSTVQRLRGEFLIENNQGAHAQLRLPLGEEGIRPPPCNRYYSDCTPPTADHRSSPPPDRPILPS